MFKYIKYGTINDVMYILGTLTSETELGRTAKQMVDEDLRVKGLGNTPNFEPSYMGQMFLSGRETGELMMSHWQQVK